MPEGSPDYTKLVRMLGRDEDGNLVTVALDPFGRIFMLPYGWDGTTYRKLRVDEDGRMIGVMKGQADITWDLHGWWKFIASEGIVVKDYSGYGNNLDAHSGGNGVANYVDGVIGQALQFNGVDAYVGLSDDSSLSFPTAMSIEAWVNPTIPQITRIVRMDGDAVTYGYYMLSQDDLRILMVLYDKGITNETRCLGTSYLNPGTWYHVVATTDRIHVKLYVNGILENTVDDLTSDPLGKEKFCIGANAGASEFFKGSLDEVRLYNRCLSQDEVSWRYNNTNPVTGKPTRMVAVDNEGRMMVNVNDLPYKARILSSYYDTAVGLESLTIDSDVVSSGKLWILTQIIAYCANKEIDSLLLSINDGVHTYLLERNNMYTMGDTLKVRNQVTLKGGDRISALFNAVPDTGVCILIMNGYELDVV